MWLDNFKIIISNALGGYSSSNYKQITLTDGSTEDCTLTSFKFPRLNNSTSTISYSAADLQESYETPSSSYTFYANYPVIIVGTGSTEVDKSDYRLDNAVFPFDTIQVTTVPAIDNYTVSITEVLTNTTNDSVEITELGLAYMPNDSTSKMALIMREVLDTPITIGASEAKSITISIDLSTMLP